MQPRLSMWYFIWICCVTLRILPKVVSKTPQHTTRLLHELYEGTGGGNWNYTGIAQCLIEYELPSYIGKSWNFATDAKGEYVVDPCSKESHFIGLNCTDESIINAIALPCGGLSGMIPGFLGQLTGLTNLNLGNNHLSGTIPELLEQLTGLQELGLDENQLSGTIPGFLGQLTGLTNLNLGANHLSGTIPELLEQLTGLQVLNLGANHLSATIPELLGHLTGLIYLGLGANQLSGTIPEFLGHLTGLEVLILIENQRSGTIPEFLGQLTRLQVLNLGANQRSGTIPEFLGQLTRLQVLNLGANQLSGTIPEFLGTLTRLQQLNLGANQLSGTIPDLLGQLTGLQELDLSTNQLSSTIPVILGHLKGLTHLSLIDNQLSGTIPEILGYLTGLTYLSLIDNQLSGTIPEFLGHLTGLIYLGLGANQLSGTIPEFLGHLTGLIYLGLGENQLSGAISEFLGQLTGLQFLTLNQNQLTGTIPEALGNLKNMRSLVLGSNCLSGTIPESICSLHELIFLELTSIGGGAFCREYFFVDSYFGSEFNGFISSYYLSGTIPECVWGLGKLTSLYASGNRLSGSIPDIRGVSLQIISLSYNYLDGSLPKSLVKHPNMTVELSHNRIQGDLSVFENAKDIKKLNASVNRLSGSIPKSLLHLDQIDILAGNVFGCTWGDHYQLPSSDPSSEKYQCGSNSYNLSFYLYLVLAFLGALIACYVYRQMRYTREMQLWIDVVRGKKWRETRANIKMSAIHRYAYHLFDLRWSVLKTLAFPLIVCTIYLILSESRLVEKPYGWITTAAYITGKGASICLTCIYIVVVFLMTLLLYTDNGDETAVTGESRKSSDGVPSVSSSDVALFAIRIACFSFVIWGVLIAGNAYYLYILLTGSTAVQDSFRPFFDI